MLYGYGCDIRTRLCDASFSLLQWRTTALVIGLVELLCGCQTEFYLQHRSIRKKSDFAINLVSHYENVANVNFNEYEFKRFLKYPLQTWLLQTVGCPPRKTKCVLSFLFFFWL